MSSIKIVNGNHNIHTCDIMDMILDTNIKIYKGQRYLDKDRVNEITSYFLDKYNEGDFQSYNSIITFCKLPKNKSLYLIDGQHRYSSMIEFYKTTEFNFNVIFSVLIVNDKTQIREEFVNINKSVPVPLNVTSPYLIVNECVSILKRDFTHTFSQSLRTCRPKISEDSFKDFIINSNVIENMNIETGEELVNKFIELNNLYSKMEFEFFLEKLISRDVKHKHDQARHTLSNIFERIKRSNKYMYLGMFPSSDMIVWLNDLLEYENCLVYL